MDIKKQPTNEKPNTADVVRPTSAHTYASGVEASKSVKHKNSKKKFFIIAGLVVLLAIVAFISFWVYQNKIANQDIKIGDTVITKTDINNYIKSIEAYKTENPNIVVPADTKQLAVDDLVMNAALKKEAKARNIYLSDEEIRKIYNVPKDDKYYKSKIDSARNTAKLENYFYTNKENITYRRILNDALIAKRSVFYTAVNFDAPYFRAPENQSKLPQLHQQAKDILNNQLLPLFDKGLSKEEIAKQAMVNYLSPVAGSNNIYKFSNEVVSFATFRPSYQYKLQNTENIPELITLDSNKTPSSFQDLENVDYGIKVPDLKNTNEEIAKLKKAGDHTGVFASKTGNYMIARLENKSGGDYINWQEFLDKYKDKSIPSNFYLSSTIKANSVASKAINGAVSTLITNTAQKAEARTIPVDECPKHEGDFAITMINTDNWNEQVAGYVKMKQAKKQYDDSGNEIASNCKGGEAESNSGKAGFRGNCWNIEPVINYTVPSGWDFVKVGGDDYKNTPDINTGHHYNKYIHVRKQAVKYDVSSHLIKEDGGNFGGNYTLSSEHKIVNSTGREEKSSTALDLYMDQINPEKSATITAPDFIYTNNDRPKTWTRRSGEASITVNTAKNKEWKYYCSAGCDDEPPPPPPPTNNAPTCSVTTNPATTVTPGTTVNIAWTSQNAVSAYSSSFDNIGINDNRYVTIPTTNWYDSMAYVIVVVSSDGTQGSCTAIINVADNPPPPPPNVPPPSVDIRANGDNGPITLNLGDPLVLSWSSSNVRQSPQPVCRASSNPNIPSWGGGKPPNSGPENHSGDINPSITTITYTITCSGLAGSSPDTATDSVTVSVNQASYYPWLQTQRGDIGSLGTINGQLIGPSNNPSVNPGGRRYDNASNKTTPVSEAEFIVAASGTGVNFCSFGNYVLGVSKSQAQLCNTGGYTRTGIDFASIVAATDNAFTQNGAGDPTNGRKCIPSDSTNTYNTDDRSTAKTLIPNIDLGCNSVNASKGPNGGGGIQRVVINPYDTFNLSVPSTQRVTGKGTLYVKSNGIRQPANLKISSNILYPNTVSSAGNKPNDLPNFSIVVDGDVYIDNSVTEINAAIFASGTIYTCSENIATINPNVTYNFGIACTNKLTIYGLLAAGKNIDFGRRVYDTANPNGNPAERIILTYQSIMFPPPGLSRSDGNTSTQLQNDFAELPPILK